MNGFRSAGSTEYRIENIYCAKLSLSAQLRIYSRMACLQDGTKKMSKSDESDLSRINLLDDPKTITNKVKRAKTDAFEGLEDDNPERPEARNLLAIYQLMTGYSKVHLYC